MKSQASPSFLKKRLPAGGSKKLLVITSDAVCRPQPRRPNRARIVIPAKAGIAPADQQQKPPSEPASPP
jgi:hypothetical protein